MKVAWVGDDSPIEFADMLRSRNQVVHQWHKDYDAWVIGWYRAPLHLRDVVAFSELL